MAFEWKEPEAVFIEAQRNLRLISVVAVLLMCLQETAHLLKFSWKGSSLSLILAFVSGAAAFLSVVWVEWMVHRRRTGTLRVDAKGIWRWGSKPLKWAKVHSPRIMSKPTSGLKVLCLQHEGSTSAMEFCFDAADIDADELLLFVENAIDRSRYSAHALGSRGSQRQNGRAADQKSNLAK